MKKHFVTHIEIVRQKGLDTLILDADCFQESFLVKLELVVLNLIL